MNWCQAADSDDFSFGSILVAWFLQRVPMLRLRVLLDALSIRESQLRWWVAIFIHHGGGEGGHYFTVDISWVWHQMPQIIHEFPYSGVDFWEDPEMVLPPGEVFDHRGMLMYLIV
jgi:hypothetical protein